MDNDYLVLKFPLLAFEFPTRYMPTKEGMLITAEEEIQNNLNSGKFFVKQNYINVSFDKKFVKLLT